MPALLDFIVAQESSATGETVGLVITGAVIAGLGWIVWRTRQKATRDYWERQRKSRDEEVRRKRRMKGLEDEESL